MCGVEHFPAEQGCKSAGLVFLQDVDVMKRGIKSKTLESTVIFAPLRQDRFPAWLLGKSHRKWVGIPGTWLRCGNLTSLRPVGLVNFHGAGWGFLLAGASRASLTVRKGTESGLGRGSQFSWGEHPWYKYGLWEQALHDQSWCPQHSCTQWPALPSHEMTPGQIYKCHDILVQVDPLWALSLGKKRVMRLAVRKVFKILTFHPQFWIKTMTSQPWCSLFRTDCTTYDHKSSEKCQFAN